MIKITIQVVRLSLLYFTAVFLVETLLGLLRVKLLQPHLRTRYAEIYEMPIMLIWVWQAAQLTLWQLEEEERHKRAAPITPILISGFGLIFLIIAKLRVIVTRQRRLSNLCEVYFSERDVVAEPAY